MMQFPLTVTPLLERAGKLFSTVEIVSSRPDNSIHRYTYREMHRRARALAAALQALGLHRGDRVATLMWNHHVHLEAYFGVPSVGGVLHTLNLRLHPDELAHIINDAEDRWLIVDDVLATGGTARAARDVVSELGASVVGVGVVIELSFLSGRGQLDDTEVFAVLDY